MKTFIGQLIFGLKDNTSPGSKKIVGNIRSIERAAKRLSSANWGVNFQRQLEKIGASSGELQALNRSWTNLHANIKAKNLNKALAKSEISGWKTATLSHFAQVRAGMALTEKRAARMGRSLKDSMRPFYVMMGGYTGVYMAGMAGRAALGGTADRQREYFRQKMASIPEKERKDIYSSSQRLSERFPSVGTTDVMEMGRMSRGLMGSTKEGLKIQEAMVKAIVVLQSSKGMEAASPEIIGFLRGMDNLGQNMESLGGAKNIVKLIDSFIKASQVEGLDLDIGQVFAFARRAKIGGPGLSSEFLGAVAPALIQDMTAPGAGTALSSAYQAYVIGAKSVASKINIKEQHRLGIRKDNELVDGDLFGSNPYAWVKKYMIPALEKDGVDINNPTAVAKAVSKTSMNTKGTGFIVRLITQSEQIERSMRLYSEAQGLVSAELAGLEDPRVAGRGFAEALKNLSAAVGEHVMPTIVPGINSFAQAITRFSDLVKQGDPDVMKGAAAAGGALGLYGVYKGVRGVAAIFAAGPALVAASVSLEAAAVSLGAGGVLSGAGGKKKGMGLLGKAGLVGVLGVAGGIAAAADHYGGDNRRAMIAKGAAMKKAAIQKAVSDNLRRNQISAYTDPRRSGKYKSPYQSALDEHRAATSQISFDKSGIASPVNRAADEMQKTLSVTAKPVVETSSIDTAIAKAKQLLSILGLVDAKASVASSSVDRSLRRSLSDGGAGVHP